MIITTPVDRIKLFNKNDPNWFWTTDGFTLVPRAAIQISDDCPAEYKMLLAKCINKGWVNPIAYMKESSYVWEKLKD